MQSDLIKIYFMDRVDEMRVLMNQMELKRLAKMEIIGYMRIPMKDTGLPYDVYADDSSMYKDYRHKLWMYVRNGVDYIAVTVEENPQLIVPIRGNSINIEPLFAFIKKNIPPLRELADMETEAPFFFSDMVRVDEERDLIGGALLEMSRVSSKVTGLPTDIWVDENETYRRHAPRIKFKALPEMHDTYQYTSMEINDPTKIHNLPPKTKISGRKLKQIEYFVNANKDNLLALANKQMEIMDFYKCMKCVDCDGNITNGDGITIEKEVNGFCRCMKNGKYNYLKSNGKHLFNNFIFDDASHFMRAGDALMAWVKRGDEDFYIDNFGNRLNI